MYEKYPEPKEGTPEYDAAIAEWNKVKYKWDRQVEFMTVNIQEQLDLLWHDIDQGKLDKTGDFYKAIKGIKDRNPKPSS